VREPRDKCFSLRDPRVSGTTAHAPARTAAATTAASASSSRLAPGAEGAAGMHVDAVFALGGERDRDGDQFSDFWRDHAVGAERRMVELEEGIDFARCKPFQRRYQRKI
jgi:hypothetical protein